jgi:MoaA/NifB/PqqE/SkfB family radical SAM enzyme
MQFQKTNRNAYLNFLRSKYEMMTGEILVKSYPYYMGLDPTSICQLRCPSCPTGVENESRRSGAKLSLRTRTMMAGDLLSSLLDEVGEYLHFVMFYNWGEPLLNRELPAYIRRAKDYKICTEIHTNLSLRLGEEFLEDLLVSGLDVLAASVDGFTQETYETYRRGGNLALIRTNIERLVALRERLGLKTEIIWNFLVFSFNEHEIEVTQRYCQDIGIIFQRREAFITNPDWLPSYRKHEAELLARRPDTPKHDLGPSQAQPKGRPSPCAWHYSYSFVNADGSVSPCCLPWEQKYDFGVIQPGSIGFADIWNNNLFRKSRGVFADKEVRGLEKVETICTRCPYGPNIQNLYTYMDVEVLNQFHRVFDGKDPLLEQGFSLLQEREQFIGFYERNKHLIDSGVQAAPESLAALAETQSGVAPLSAQAGGAAGSQLHRHYLDIKNRMKPYSAWLSKKLPRL